MERTSAPAWREPPKLHSDLVPIDAGEPPLWLRRFEDLCVVGCAIFAGIAIAAAIAAAFIRAPWS